jgi:hypothetical protein
MVHDAEVEDEAHGQLVIQWQMVAKYAPWTGAYGLRARKPRSYMHLHLM